MTSVQETRRSPTETKGRIQRALRACPLFERVSRAAKDAVADAASIQVSPGGSVVVTQGGLADALFFVGRGRARVERRTADGRVVPLGYRGTGDVLGEACFGRKRHAESVVLMEEAELVKLPARSLHDVLVADPSMGSALLTLLVARQREVEERIESMLFCNVEARLADFLLKAADRWGVPNPRGVLISAPITHLEIAQAIGSTRETVTLTLGSLRRTGVVDVAGRRLIVKDREALASRQ